jgi:hypothetical protein
MPVAMVAFGLKVYLPFLQLGFLKAEHVRVRFIEIFRETFVVCRSQAVYVP